MVCWCDYISKWILYSFIISITTLSGMNLNEQLIQDMFQDEQEESEQIQIPREDISLNFTVSSGNTKHQKEKDQKIRQLHHKDDFEIISLANNQLAKFNQWLAESQNKCDLNIGSISTLITELQVYGSSSIAEHDLIIIKNQISKKDSEAAHENNPCKQCLEIKIKMENLENLNKEQQQTILVSQQHIQRLIKQKEEGTFQQLKEDLLNKTEINILVNQIKELSNEILVLRSEKANLEKTNLFNRTKNSQIHLLQKSKGLSAAKNSTNSSEVMLRNHDSIVFIDPIESDVDQWIKFFEIQKNKYKNLCKKEETDRQRDLGRTFTKQQKAQLHLEGRLFILFSSIKQVVKNLTKIRQNTNAFLSNENTSKSSLKQRLCASGECDSTSLLPLREQNERLLSKLTKFSKINDYLQREKQNLEEINNSLKEQRFKENSLRNMLQEKLNDLIEELHITQEKYGYCQQENSKLKKALAKKQEELAYCIDQFNHINGENSDLSYTQLEHKIKAIQKEYEDNITKQKIAQIQVKSLELKLKKESLQRRKLHNQLEDSKGSFRVYCRIRPKLMNEQYQSVFARAVQDRLIVDQQKCYKFDKIFHNDMNSQQKVFEDIKKLVQSALDGFNLSIFAYGQTGSGKSYTMHGSPQNPGIIPRVFKQIFRMIENQQHFITAQVQIKLIELHHDKFNDLLRQDKSQARQIQIKEDEDGNIYLLNSSTLKVYSLQDMEEVYYQSLKTRKTKTSDRNDQGSRSHFITMVMLDIHNKKTQERYRSKINLIDLAGSEKVDHVVNKESAWISKSLSALSNVILFVNSNKSGCCLYRDSKLTHLLKDSLILKSKIVLMVNIAAGENNKQQTKASINYSFRTKGIGLQKMKKENEKDEIVRQKRSISRMNNC